MSASRGFDFKSADEVQLYLKNLGIEYRFSCYKENNPDGCHLLGDYMEAVTKDFAKAAQVYKRNCDENKFPKSCYKFGNYSLLGRGCERNEDTAFSYFKTGCSHGDPYACYHAGMMLTSPQVKMTKNFPEGLKYLDKGCAGNDELACFQASLQYFHGKNGVPKDLKKAFECTERSCHLGNMKACSNLAIMYRNGDGVEKNEEMEKRYLNVIKDYHDQLKRPQIEFG